MTGPGTGQIGVYSPQTLEKWFSLRSPTGEQQAQIRTLFLAGKALCNTILNTVPVGPEQTLAIETARTAVMQAVNGIVYGEG